jgi:DNA-binding response OmpR family regulator
MNATRILIVEDDILIGLDVEHTLIAAGYDVCGIATSEKEALAMADEFHPEMAIVDINLSPGDGRVVARELRRRYATNVLFATGECNEIKGMAGTGAVACLPKPYAADEVPAALRAVTCLAKGDRPDHLPDHMFALAAA